MPTDKTIPSLEPRISILEKGQEALQANVSELSTAVKEQGRQLYEAFNKMSEIQTNNFRELHEKIGESNNKISENNKTDWATIWTMIGTLVLIIGAIFAPVWMYFNVIAKEQESMKSAIEKLENFTITSIKERTELKARLDCIKELRDEKK